MRVDVSGHKFSFPHECVCCGGAPQTILSVSASRSTGTKVVHTSSRSWDFPYCRQCMTHVRSSGNARNIAIGIAIVVWAGLAMLEAELRISAGVVTVLVGVSGGILSYLLLLG